MRYDPRLYHRFLNIEKMLEYNGEQGRKADFMLEQDTSPVDLITRRYPMVAIIKPYNTCPQICQYCQRNWEMEDAMSPQATPSLISS